MGQTCSRQTFAQCAGGLPIESRPSYMDVGNVTVLAMLAAKRSAGVATEVNLRYSLHAGNKAGKRGIHPGFETQGRHHQKSKTGVS